MFHKFFADSGGVLTSSDFFVSNFELFVEFPDINHAWEVAPWIIFFLPSRPVIVSTALELTGVKLYINICIPQTMMPRVFL